MDYKLAVCVLASGSRGNAIYVSDGITSILVDAGLSEIEIERRLKFRGISPETFSAIVVTHEHTDHILGVGVLSRRYHIPVYLSGDTKRAAEPATGKLFQSIDFEPGRTFAVRSLMLHPFALSHDAEDPVGLTLSGNGKKIGIATDMGIATGLVKDHLQECTLLVLEANHDIQMLEEGPYPWPLKQRIQGRQGHLSNVQSRDLLKEIRHRGLAHVVLAHLSETNNTPEKALHTIEGSVDSRFTRIDVALQDRCGDLLILP